MYGKLFESMYDGTLRTKAGWEALVTLQQLVILCDKHGVLDVTAEALHNRTGIPLPVLVKGLRKLEEPDPESRSKAEKGRRIVRLDPKRSWGWRIVNHEYYRNLRKADDRTEYLRLAKQKSRAKQKAVSSLSTNGQQRSTKSTPSTDAVRSKQRQKQVQPRARSERKGRLVKPSDLKAQLDEVRAKLLRAPDHVRRRKS